MSLTAIKRYIAFITPLALTACANMPDFRDESPSALSLLSRQIECQIKETFHPILQSYSPKKKFSNREIDFSNWAVSYEITTKAKRSNSAGVSPLRWVIPSGIDSLIFNGDANISSIAERTGKAKFSLNIGDINEIECESGVLTPDIHKKLRVDQWIIAVNDARAHSQGFGYTTDVELEIAGSVGLDARNNRVSGVAGTSARKTFTNIVDFAFSQNTPPSKPQEVVVVNFPSGPSPRRTTPRRSTASREVRPISRTLYDVSPGALFQNNQILQQLQIERINRDR